MKMVPALQGLAFIWLVYPILGLTAQALNRDAPSALESGAIESQC